MTYARLPNIGKLQRDNALKINSVINSLTTDTPEERGEDLDITSPIETILYDWADNVTKQLNESWEAHGFNTKSTSQYFKPYVLDKSGLLKVLVLDNVDKSDAWRWAEKGRGKTKKRGSVPLWQHLEEWITYRGINVRDVRGWETKKNGKLVRPYKNISNTLKLRHIMAESFAMAIHRRGTIKRFGYKGSKWFTSVVNDDAMTDLGRQLSLALGYKISVRLAESI